MNNKKAKAIRKLIKQTTGLDYKASSSIRDLYRRAKKKSLE